MLSRVDMFKENSVIQIISIMYSFDAYHDTQPKLNYSQIRKNLPLETAMLNITRCNVQ